MVSNRRARERGFALALVVGVLAVLVLFALVLSGSVRVPSLALGESGRARRDLLAAESALARGRALLARDPVAGLPAEGIEAARDPDDTCLWRVRVRVGSLVVAETWSVVAPWRHVLHARVLYLPFGSARLEGVVFQGASAPLCALLDPLAVAPLLARATAHETAARIADRTVSNEVLVVAPPAPGAAVVLENLRIRRATVVILGDARIEGSFEGEAEEGRPLLAAVGGISFAPHPDTRAWTGAVAAGGAVELQGRFDYDGSLVGAAVLIHGAGIGRNPSPEPVLGLGTKIRTLERTERYE